MCPPVIVHILGSSLTSLLDVSCLTSDLLKAVGYLPSLHITSTLVELASGCQMFPLATTLRLFCIVNSKYLFRFMPCSLLRAWRIAISAAVAISTAFFKVYNFSVSSFFCVLLCGNQQTKQSLSVSSKKSPKLQVLAKCHKSIIKLLTVSPGCWSRLLNANHSAMTGGVGLKWLTSNSFIVSMLHWLHWLHCLGVCGATKFFKTAYAFAPNPLSKHATCFSCDTLFAVRNGSNHSK